MSTTELDIRRMTLEEAAVEICGYCRGVPGHEPLPTLIFNSWHHLFTAGNGSNQCAAGPIWRMIQETKIKREVLRSAALAATEQEKAAL